VVRAAPDAGDRWRAHDAEARDGKASFAQIRDRSGAIQLFLQQNVLGEAYDAFKAWDIGDIVGAEGTLFRTKTGSSRSRWASSGSS